MSPAGAEGILAWLRLFGEVHALEPRRGLTGVDYLPAGEWYGFISHLGRGVAFHLPPGGPLRVMR